MTVAKVLHT